MKTLNFKVFLSIFSLILGACFVQAQVEIDSSATLPELSTEPDDADLEGFIELVRSDVRTEKALVIAQNLPLTHDEAADFWPLHRQYEYELNKLLDERLSIIMEFGPMAESMTDEQAKALAKKAFALEEKHISLKRSTFKKFCKAIPATKAARFFQIENQLNAAIDLQVAAILPLIE